MVGGGGGAVKRREYGAITIEYCVREREIERGGGVLLKRGGNCYHRVSC